MIILPSQVKQTRAILKKAAASNVQGAEVHYGQVSGPPVQRTAVSGAGSGGAAAGTSIMKVPVKIDGNSTPQLCAYDDSYYPTIDDVVWLIQVGTDKRVRGHYIVGGRLAAGNQAAGAYSNTQQGAPRIVAATPSAGVLAGTIATNIVFIDPYTALGVESALFRISWSGYISASGTIEGSVNSSDGGVYNGNYPAFMLDAGSIVYANGASVTYSETGLFGIPQICKWSATAPGSAVSLSFQYSVANILYVAAVIELLKVG